MEKNQEKFDNLASELTASKIEIATLTKREKQQALQLKEKSSGSNL